MGVKERLKSVDSLRRVVKRLKIHREYLHDAKFMSRHLLDGGRSTSHEQYRIMLVVHSLEKGMAHRSPRSFGATKAASLVKLLRAADYENHGSTAYAMGVSVLRSWREFHAERADRDLNAYGIVDSFLNEVDTSELAISPAGVRAIADRDPQRWSGLPFADFVSSRHSTRRYAATPVSDQVLDEAVGLAMLSPSACNRQMVRVHMIDDPVGKRLLYNTLHGTGGVDYENCRIGVVTYDSRSLEFYGERNQGYLNAGLFAMTLIYALHWKGVGACLLQFGNTTAEERILVERLGLAPSERIAVGLSIGQLEASDTVPASVRRTVAEVLRVDAAGSLGQGSSSTDGAAQSSLSIENR
ncbi:nitroreductase family protein [Prescottella equi]|uniref:nitroreductase family protein n=1 Tax=Rhodococcus hoagii TaxID=43767 RepID=UPI002740D16C|nr:nitroreductase family protein [Prescottella equi]MDP8016041.1 nitroreductase family protein [Prescottella equi]